MKKLLVLLIAILSLNLHAQDQKISALNPVTFINDADLFYIIQSGTSKNTTWSVMKSEMSIPYVDVTTRDVKIGLAAGITSTANGDNNLIGINTGSSLSGVFNSATGTSCGLNLSGNYNTADGASAGYNATTSYSFLTGLFTGYSLSANYCFGALPYALYSNSGSNTIGIGQYAGYNNNKDDCFFLGQQSGRYSIGAKALAIGPFSLFYNISSNNIAIGDSVLHQITGNGNTVVGHNSFALGSMDTVHGSRITSFGYHNSVSDSSINDVGIFGTNISVSNDSSFTLDPAYKTIHMFDSSFTTIASGDTLATKEYVDITAATPQTEFVYGGDDAGYTLPLTLNTYTQVTNATNSQFSQDNNNVLAIVGDSVTIAETGDYKVEYNITGVAAAGTDCNVTFKIVKNGSTQVGEFYFATMHTGTARISFTPEGVFAFTAADYFELQIQNTTNSDDFVIATGTLIVTKM